MTEFQIKALKVIHSSGTKGISVKIFGQKMWPDSPKWEKFYKCGNKGVCRGGGMYKCAGGWLGKLIHQGWVESQYTTIKTRRFVLTDKGVKALDMMTKQMSLDLTF